MAQEDKFKREIDRIGMLLAKLLGLLLHRPDDTRDYVSDVMQQAHNELAIDVQGLLEMSDPDALNYLITDHKFSNDHLRQFANLLYEMALLDGGAHNSNLRKKALAIYEYLQANANGTVYLDVLYRVKELRG